MEGKPVKPIGRPVVDFDKDLRPEETTAFYEQSSDRAMGIMWAAIVENRLTEFLRLIMYRDDKQVVDELFRPTGPLGAFGTKIKLAYMLRVLDPLTYQDYINVSKIRNAFAHDLSKTSFEDQQISAWIKNMQVYGIVKDQSQSARDRLAKDQYPPNPERDTTRHPRTISPAGKDRIASQFLDSNRDAYRQCLKYMIYQIVGHKKQILAAEEAMIREQTEEKLRRPPTK